MGKNILLNVLCTSGSDRFRSLLNIYSRGSQVIILMFAVNDRESFAAINKWLDYIMMQEAFLPIIYLIGAKADLDEDERQVSIIEG